MEEKLSPATADKQEWSERERYHSSRGSSSAATADMQEWSVQYGSLEAGSQ